mgnify:CR=1 FL=1|jgi:SAM-dependent methyltransferase
MIKNERIDGGKAFDWGRTSVDYAKYRDIYPQEFYERIHSLGICTNGQRVLDLGTGTGVLPRNMYHYGADFIGTDISENQIEQAKMLAEQLNMSIAFFACPAESIDFPNESFDAITACQCFFYFNHDILAPKLHKLLKVGGKLAVCYMAWLPLEDNIAGESEKLILKYNPVWSGCNETRRKIFIPEVYNEYFKITDSIIFDLQVPFTRESWNGRIKACRGVGASLSAEDVTRFEADHIELLNKIAPEKFNVLHYAAIAVLQKV